MHVRLTTRESARRRGAVSVIVSRATFARPVEMDCRAVAVADRAALGQGRREAERSAIACAASLITRLQIDAPVLGTFHHFRVTNAVRFRCDLFARATLTDDV
jgi:hypothetical protein